MRRALLTACLLLPTASVAGTEPEAMPRMAGGLWDITMSMQGTVAGQTFTRVDEPGQVCVATGETRPMFPDFDRSRVTGCTSSRPTRQADGSWRKEAECMLPGGRRAAYVSVFQGDMEQAFTLRMNFRASDPAKPDRDMTSVQVSDLRRLGPCAPDQRPGDVIIAGNVVLNLYGEARPPS